MPVFKSGSSQTLGIPGELRTEKKEYFIKETGDVHIAYPKDDPWAQSRSVVGTFDEDFMADRNQPQCDDNREKF